MKPALSDSNWQFLQHSEQRNGWGVGGGGGTWSVLWCAAWRDKTLCMPLNEAGQRVCVCVCVCVYVCVCVGGGDVCMYVHVWGWGGGQELKIWHNSNQLLCVCYCVSCMHQNMTQFNSSHVCVQAPSGVTWSNVKLPRHKLLGLHPFFRGLGHRWWDGDFLFLSLAQRYHTALDRLRLLQTGQGGGHEGDGGNAVLFLPRGIGGSGLPRSAGSCVVRAGGNLESVSVVVVPAPVRCVKVLSKGSLYGFSCNKTPRLYAQFWYTAVWITCLHQVIIIASDIQ